ncbi:MAG: type II toxin-antitoxin system HicB family antitoxin [Candidatus Jordarchaeaceae archaeon]
MSQTYVMEWSASTASPHYSRFLSEDYEIKQRKIYKVVLEKGQNGWIVAKCLDVEGAISQGKNKEEALRNIVEAISAILEDSFGEEAPEFFITWEEK